MYKKPHKEVSDSLRTTLAFSLGGWRVSVIDVDILVDGRERNEDLSPLTLTSSQAETFFYHYRTCAHSPQNLTKSLKNINIHLKFMKIDDLCCSKSCQS